MGIKTVVPPYEEVQVNHYLAICKKQGEYQIHPTDEDYDVWLEYLEVQTVFDYNQFADINAGIALIRFYYVEIKSCKPCKCYPPLLQQLAYGEAFYDRYAFNIEGNKCQI